MIFYTHKFKQQIKKILILNKELIIEKYNLTKTEEIFSTKSILFTIIKKYKIKKINIFGPETNIIRMKMLEIY